MGRRERVGLHSPLEPHWAADDLGQLLSSDETEISPTTYSLCHLPVFENTLVPGSGPMGNRADSMRFEQLTI